MRRPIIFQIVHEHFRQLAEQNTFIAIANSRRVSAVAAIVSPRFVTNLRDTTVAALGVHTTARMVRIKPATLQHIMKRRGADADFAVKWQKECVDRAELLLYPQREYYVFELISYLPSEGRHLMVPLKFVPAARADSREDEWWVRTSVVLSHDVQTAIRKGKYRRLIPTTR